MSNGIDGKVVVSSGLGEATARLLSARVAAFAMSRPEDVDTNEIVYRPTRQES